MATGWIRALAGIAAAGALAACASIVSSGESTVQIRTNPDRARCDLKGRGGFAASVETPASVTLHSSAAPVTVTCTAPGFRPTVSTLDATANGWIWGNSAFLVATGGVAILGALVDESRGAGKNYEKDVSYELEVDRPRAIKATERNGGRQMELQAR